MYAITREDLSNPSQSFCDVRGRNYLMTQTHTMRLCQPNDDMASKILLALPQVAVHELDYMSPL